MADTTCAICSCTPRPGRTFTFRGTKGQSEKCLRCALGHWPMLRRSLLTALLVGTILAVLNQGDRLFSGSWVSAFYWKIPLTYCVPFLVTTWGALSNSRR
ncbi:MAG: nitrate/nitrite transporter NrtS [Dehalococcoidia bacterium]|nr:nitrate/nitrite transporter NrtS [Dehalococcoidia bacterium]